LRVQLDVVEGRGVCERDTGGQNKYPNRKVICLQVNEQMR